MFIFEPMAFYKLNRKYLATFIFLIDSIEERDFDVDYQEIADFETKKLDTAHKISIDRAFKLRTALKKGWNKKPGLPLKTTLNVMAAYFESNESYSFLKFHLKYEDKIKVHFDKNRPQANLITKLFPERAEKITHLERNLETVELSANEAETNGVEKFKQDLELQFNNFRKKIENELKLKTDYIRYLEQKVEDIESTLKRAEFFDGKLGAIGLFFVGIDYGVLTKESLLNDFFGDYDGIDSDSILDDLL